MIDKLFKCDGFDLLYSKEDFKGISNVCMEIIKCSHSLIEDFYSFARSDIIGISKETDKIMVKQKLR